MKKESPKSIKFSRCFRLKLKNKIKFSNINLNQYKYGFKAIEYGWINSIQLNSLLRMIKIKLKKKYKLKLNTSLIIPITKKPLETRMGSGKGERKFWQCPVFKGMIIMEFNKISLIKAKALLKLIKNRLKFSIKLIKIIY